MYVAMEAHTPCPACGYRIKIIMTGSARVNKRSIRVMGPFLGAFKYLDCPECGVPVARDTGSVPRSAYRLVPEDAAKVVAYRRKKWGIEDPPGPLMDAPLRKTAARDGGRGGGSEADAGANSQ